MKKADEPKTRGRKPKVEHVPGLFFRKFRKKRADGSYYEYEGTIHQICYSAPDPLTGKPKMHFESAKTKSRSKAEKFLNQRKQEVLAKTHPHAVSKSEQTLTDYIDDNYLKDDEVLALRGLDKKILVLNQVKAYLGRHKINSLTADMVREYIKYKTEERKKVLIDQVKARNLKKKATGIEFEEEDEDEVKPLAVATKNRHIATIKTIYAHGFEAGVVSQRAMTEMNRLSKGTENNARLRYLALTEIPTLLKTCCEHSEHLRQMVEFALTTGLRKGRVYLLEWRMIDMEHNFLHIPKDKDGDRFDVPLGSGAMRVLNERLTVRRDDCKYVFYNPFDGNRWSDLKEGFNQSVAKAGIDDFHWHDLRHTFISHLVMADVSIAKVKELAGHATIEMTMRYAHLAPDNLASAVERLPY